MARRLLIAFVLATLVLALVPGVAGASVKGDCTGSAEIRGVTYTPANDTPGNAIPIPDKPGIRVTYSGSVGFENIGHSGVAKVQVGPFNITLANAWEGTNEDDDRAVTDKVYELDDFRDKLPIWIPGVWKVTASHSASGGACSGFAMIKLDGSPLGSVVGRIVLIGLLALVYSLTQAIRKKRFVRAIFSALFFGLFLSLALMMWSIRPLETFTVVILPLLLAGAAVVAVVLLKRQQAAI